MTTDGRDEVGRILYAYWTGLSTCDEALESLRKLDPASLACRPAGSWFGEDAKA